MRNLKYLAFTGLLAGVASIILGSADAQMQAPAPGPSVAEIKATAEAIQTLEDQQKTITDNQAKIDAKLAGIADAVHQTKLFAARVR